MGEGGQVDFSSILIVSYYLQYTNFVNRKQGMIKTVTPLLIEASWIGWMTEAGERIFSGDCWIDLIVGKKELVKVLGMVLWTPKEMK